MKGLGMKAPAKPTEKEYFKTLKKNLVYFLAFALTVGVAPYAIEFAQDNMPYVDV